MNLSRPHFALQTPRLQLRRFLDNDFAAYAAYHCRPDVYRFLYMAAPQGDELMTQFTDVLRAPFEKDGDVFRLAVTRQEDGLIVGEVLLKIASFASLQLEVGYIFNPHYAGQGYAAESVRAMLTWGFESAGAHRIFARLDALNTASFKLVERLGMRKEAHLIQNDRFEGVWGDEFIYAMLQSEWRVAQSALSGQQTQSN